MSIKLNILLVSPIPPPEGGIASWSIEYMNQMHNLCNNIELINTSLIGQRRSNISQKKNIYDEIVRTYNIFREAIKKKYKYNYNIIHFNSSCSSFGIIRDYIMISYLNFNLNIPIVFQCHCNVNEISLNRLQTFFLKKIALKASKVITLNNESNNFISKFQKVNTTILPNFLNKKYIVKHKFISNKINNIIFVGHVQESKGCIEIVEAAKAFPSINFVFVGPVNDIFDNIKLPKNIDMVGRKSNLEVRNYLKNADVFILPSYSEGFSMALLEAMANGLPVITTSVGANKEMIGNEGGIIINQKSVSEIIDAIYKLENKEIRERMSTRNINKVSEFYTSEIVLQKLISLYRHIS